jgi:transposase
MVLMMVMTLCLLVYSALEYRLRQALTTHRQPFPDQKGKTTSQSTARGVFQCFVGIHLLILHETEDLVLNLEGHHQHLYEAVYS